MWGLWQQNINPENVLGQSGVLCWAAKWLDDDECYFSSVEMTSRKKMLKEIHDMLDEADAVVGYNTDRFDLKILNTEFVLAGMSPPAPYKSIDLLKVMKKRFRFTSNKLDDISRRLGIGQKAKHNGMALWLSCMNPKASDYDESWDVMEEYNIKDVYLTEDLYNKVQGWISNHPNRGSFDGTCSCPNCASTKFQSRGFSVAKSLKYRRYQCSNCGTWFRAAKSEPMLPVEKRLVSIA